MQHNLMPRRNFLQGTALAGMGLVVAGRVDRSAWAADAPKPKTANPGVITVAMNGDMPMTSVKDGKIIGTDGEMIAAIAQRLGLGMPSSWSGRPPSNW